MRKGFMAAIVCAAMLCGCGNTTQVEASGVEVGNGRFETTWADINVSTMTDTETGVIYLLFKQKNGSNSVGGITPLLNADGSVTIDPRYGGSDD